MCEDAVTSLPYEWDEELLTLSHREEAQTPGAEECTLSLQFALEN